MHLLHATAFCLAVASLASSSAVQAQDAVAVDPAHHKVEFENGQIRILRIVFPSGESSVMHTHPCLVAIGLTDSELTFHFPDGSERQATLKRGQIVKVDRPTTHQPENRGSATSEVMVVELKSGC